MATPPADVPWLPSHAPTPVPREPCGAPPLFPTYVPACKAFRICNSAQRFPCQRHNVPRAPRPSGVAQGSFERVRTFFKTGQTIQRAGSPQRIHAEASRRLSSALLSCGDQRHGHAHAQDSCRRRHLDHSKPALRPASVISGTVVGLIRGSGLDFGIVLIYKGHQIWLGLSTSPPTVSKGRNI